MARKRGGKPASASKDSPPPSIEIGEASATTTGTHSEPDTPTPSTPQPEIGVATPSVVEETGSAAEELKAAKQELAALKAQLAAKDAEIAALKASQGLGTTGSAAADSNRGAEMSKLRERLAALKREQQDADSARKADCCCSRHVCGMDAYTRWTGVHSSVVECSATAVLLTCHGTAPMPSTVAETHADDAFAILLPGHVGEAAWRQLKDVVGEISRLAAPVQSDVPRTPTAPNTAVPVA